MAWQPLRAGPLKQYAGHAVPVVDPDRVGLQRNVGGRLRGRQEKLNVRLHQQNLVNVLVLASEANQGESLRRGQTVGRYFLQ